ncbi:hypothetical protein A6P39_040395 [Streptomyces sp. FXJ1.172]|uniref:hypothetical protein n=1 Tax=Streptomyces sp. FXJ1.172 TaxID=710705 RepID=UPI000ABBC30C|nr:hypothetical protein [Streptomyces sp. FXJ1.172]WEO99803.1 hypothetical protein A6P39_040395 [Streptomyces sp. FXJ1.172]
MEKAIDGAAFDLATDIAYPTAAQAEFGYDVDTDLGVEPGWRSGSAVPDQPFRSARKP